MSSELEKAASVTVTVIDSAPRTAKVVSRRSFAKSITWAAPLVSLSSCGSADSDATGSPFDNCGNADYSLLYYGFTGEKFHVLNMCGSEKTFEDSRFSARSPIRILGIGNGGDHILLAYVYDSLRQKDPPIYVYSMTEYTHKTVNGFSHVGALRLSADGDVIVGILRPGTGTSNPLEIVVCVASLSSGRYQESVLKLHQQEALPRNLGVSANGRVIVFSQGDRMWRLDPSVGRFEFLGRGKSVSCSPDGTQIAFTEPEGRLVIRSLLSSAKSDVMDLSAVDGLEWYPNGKFGVAAAPSWIPPLGFPRPDDLYFVDVKVKRWRKLTLQRGWIGASSLRWIKKSISLQAVLDQVHKDIKAEGDSEDWFNELMRKHRPAAK